MSDFHAFLSYSHADSHAAQRIKERLQQRGLKVFIDTHDIIGGDLWQAALERCAAEAPCALILVGTGGVTNWQRAEVELFLAENRQRQMRLIPVLLPGASMPSGFLSQYQHIDLRSGVSEEGVRAIAFAITGQGRRFAHKCLLVHPHSSESVEWVTNVARPVCRELDVDVQLVDAGNPSMWHGVQQTDFVIADLSEGDYRTVYAVGLCHAASRPVIAVTRKDEPPRELSFGGIGLIHGGMSVEDDQRALHGAILRLREDPTAGNALPRVGLFQQLKLIRKTYAADRRALSLAVRWFREHDQALTRQIESRCIRIEVSDFQRVREWLFDYLEDGDQILATCFTDMVKFYYRRDVGTEYFRLNAAAIRNRHVSMHRIFQVPNDVWRRNNILLRELVDMYLDLDCKVSVVRAADVDDSPQLRKRDDFLLICDGAGEPRAAIDFDLDEAGIRSIEFKFAPEQLQEKKRYFTSLEAIAVPHTRADPKPRRTVDQMVATITDLSKATRNTNTTSYIFDASYSDDDIAAYWMGLKGGLIRPVGGACEAIKDNLRRALAARRLTRFEHALILGSTPEARALAREFAHRITVADISDVMYHAMSRVLENEFQLGGPEEHETFLLGEWRGVCPHAEGFDLVLAFDSFNMLHTEDLRHLVKQLRQCVRTDACIIMQWANVPEAVYLQTCKGGATHPTVPEAVRALIRSGGNGASGNGKEPLDHHELFARLALSQFRTTEQRLTLRPVVDFLTNSIVVLDSESEQVAQKIQKTYALCNTTLYFHPHLRDGVGLKQLDVQRLNPRNDNWTSLFSVGTFVFQDGPRGG